MIRAVCRGNGVILMRVWIVSGNSTETKICSIFFNFFWSSILSGLCWKLASREKPNHSIVFTRHNLISMFLLHFGSQINQFTEQRIFYIETLIKEDCSIKRKRAKRMYEFLWLEFPALSSLFSFVLSLSEGCFNDIMSSNILLYKFS